MLYYLGSAAVFRTIFAMIADKAGDTGTLTHSERVKQGVDIVIEEAKQTNAHIHLVLYGLVEQLLERAIGRPLSSLEQVRIPVEGAPDPDRILCFRLHRHRVAQLFEGTPRRGPAAGLTESSKAVLWSATCLQAKAAEWLVDKILDLFGNAGGPELPPVALMPPSQKVRAGGKCARLRPGAFRGVRVRLMQRLLGGFPL